jgi:hypothetical protein
VVVVGLTEDEESPAENLTDGQPWNPARFTGTSGSLSVAVDADVDFVLVHHHNLSATGTLSVSINGGAAEPMSTAGYGFIAYLDTVAATSIRVDVSDPDRTAPLRLGGLYAGTLIQPSRDHAWDWRETVSVTERRHALDGGGERRLPIGERVEYELTWGDMTDADQGDVTAFVRAAQRTEVPFVAIIGDIPRVVSISGGAQFIRVFAVAGFEAHPRDDYPVPRTHASSAVRLIEAGIGIDLA